MIVSSVVIFNMISFTRLALSVPCCSTDPCTAPEEALRSCGSAPSAVVTDRSFCISCHREVHEPCRSKVAEYFSFRIETFLPVICPRVSHVSVSPASLKLLESVYPFHNVIINIDLAVFYPFRSIHCWSIHGMYHLTEDVILYPAAFIVSAVSLKCIPVRYIFLNLCQDHLFQELLLLHHGYRIIHPGSPAMKHLLIHR